MVTYKVGRQRATKEPGMHDDIYRWWMAHSSPTTDRCAAQDFKLQPVTMSADERTADDLGGKLVDQLDYAAGLLDAARAQWDNFCGNRASASDTIAFLNSRLTAANQTLDFVKDTLDLRAKSRASG
jgi:hypothetical protein